MNKLVDRTASEPLEQDHFAKLECLETLAPKGSLSVSKLVSAFEDVLGLRNGVKLTRDEAHHLLLTSSGSSVSGGGGGGQPYFSKMVFVTMRGVCELKAWEQLDDRYLSQYCTTVVLPSGWDKCVMTCLCWHSHEGGNGQQDWTLPKACRAEGSDPLPQLV